MLIPNHPADERLAAWADADDDARADVALADHVPTCVRCAEVVAELGALRAVLADLPDMAPPRPLRLLPPVADAPAASAGAGGWVRRLFAPMITAGAALALVGVVGTAAPIFPGAGAGAFDMDTDAGGAEAVEGEATDRLSWESTRAPAGLSSSLPPDAAGGEAPMGGEAATASEDEGDGVAAAAPTPSDLSTYSGGDGAPSVEQLRESAVERPIWPMLLFTGVALVIGALMLRWILAPRAG